MSISWIDKWKKRLLRAPLDDEQVLQGLSRAPHHPPPRLDQQVVDRVLEIRDAPGIVNLIQGWVCFLCKVGKKNGFWGLFS
jgi:hypothetical protein